MVRQWWRTWRSCLARSTGQRRHGGRGPGWLFRPGAEPLEERTLLSATLLKDIGFLAPATFTPASGGGDFASVHGKLLFAASDGVHGTELWESYGTPAGTVLLKDIAPGSAGSNPGDFTVVNGTLYFTAKDGTHGSELWKSDGTAAGTVLVKDIAPGSAGSNPAHLTNVNGTLYFTANDGTHGVELWKSNGTPAGTVLVKDVHAGPVGSNLTSLTNVNGTLYFTANDGVHGSELWKSNGTAGGTVLVKDVAPGSAGSNPANLTNVNGTLYFTANEGVHGVELWKSNGRAAGTLLVKDIASGSIGSNPANLTYLNGVLFFTANDAHHGTELWRSNGTAAGTTLVKDIAAGSAGANPADLTAVNGTLYFTANDGTHGVELWKSNGTAAGTLLVKDIDPGKSGSNPANLTNVNGSLLLTANDGSHGTELWQSDGTAAGTVLVQDMSPGPGSTFSPGAGLVNANGTLYFTTRGGSHGVELWRYTPAPPPRRLTVSAGGPYVIPAGANLTLTASLPAGISPRGLTYSWDLNGDGKFGDAGGAHPTLTWAQLQALHISARTTPYSVRVRVTDGAGHTFTSAATTLTVRNVSTGLTGTNVNVTEGALFHGAVALLNGAGGLALGQYSVSIDWGDGSPATAGTVASVGGFDRVMGSHTYAQAGFYGIVARVTSPNGRSLRSISTATVADASLWATGVGIAPRARQPFSGRVASFIDANPLAQPENYTVTIDWGAGHLVLATVTESRPGHFDVSGAFTYTRPGTNQVTVTITDHAGSRATTRTLITVSG